ncbi:cytochrome P450 [Artemisia annua]|uniref:Cytochrome P450 n=1 Tax=Artemisia annua TaxID=35608 RepID=A0A2U1P218_ARTAN|nr:cytochrome P450 [Artemisia annua]
MLKEAMLLRHITPPSLWKLQQLLRVGKENKLSNARKTLDRFIYKSIDQKQNDYNNTEHQEKKFIFITTFMTLIKNHNGTSLNPTKFQRDNIWSLMAAGKDTTSSALSWFFCLLSRNPDAEDKILKEIRSHLEVKVGERWHVKELDEMAYFHGALCESLRLFPSIPLNHKSPFQPDILPSGHQVFPNTKIILSYYSMGRMKSIWGEDCMEFKPERWILKDGGIKRESSYKFASFGSGPRACVGKNMALSHLKIVSTMIIYHYHIELVECHPVLPQDSIVLQMKHGLKVRLTKRG